VDSLFGRLKGGMNKWRIAFLFFVVAYAFFLLLNLSYMSVRWDEVTHLNGGLYFLHGDFISYLKFNGFYPPMFDLVTTVFFSVAGPSLLAARLVSVVFSLLSLYVVFEFGYRLYEPKIGLLASILLGIMPGYIFLSRLALIETMLLFFFTVSALLFFVWIRNGKNKYLLLSGLALGLGVLTKYQVVIVGAIMLTGLVVLGRGYLKPRLKRFPLLILTAILIFVPWIIVSYQLYSSGMLNTWLYALNVGNPDKTLYSLGLNGAGGNRLPHLFLDVPSWLQMPIFYLLEITAPYFDVHPISFFLYFLGLAGLALFAWRRRPIDKYLLLWFVIIYVFFTVIPNRQWRYVIPIFPVLALSASSFLSSSLSTARNIWRNKHVSISEKRFSQVIACILIGFTLVALYYNVEDANLWIAKDQVYIPIQEASQYAAGHIGPGESIVVLNAQNLFSEDMVRFYMNAKGKTNYVWQYPADPVDTYTINFNITDFVNLCKQHNTKYVFTYEFGGTVTYFNSTLSLRDIYQMLYNSGNFSKLLDNETYIFGLPPRRIFVLSFLG
jgi:4-amino-4-deoxy-L-arabinose transferase-like glycosyltransferase